MRVSNISVQFTRFKQWKHRENSERIRVSIENSSELTSTCSKSTLETLEKSETYSKIYWRWRHSGVSIVNSEHISRLFSMKKGVVSIYVFIFWSLKNKQNFEYQSLSCKYSWPSSWSPRESHIAPVVANVEVYWMDSNFLWNDSLDVWSRIMFLWS